LSHGKNVVENFFEMLKKMFWDMRLKTSLQIFFLLVVVVCYYMLHNSILNGRDINTNDSIGNWKWLAKVPMWKEEGWTTKWRHWCWNLAILL
jgi:hypothetical protein